jgi:hypothetical protein
MRSTLLLLLLGLSTFGPSAGAEEFLRLRNTGGQEKVEFLFRSVSRKFEPMQRVTLQGKNEVRVSLTDPDLYVVMVRFPPTEHTGTLHTCFSKPIDLRAIARSGKVVDLRSVPAMGPNGDKQITHADITFGGTSVPVIRRLEAGSEYSKGVVSGEWRSTYTAIDGSQQQSVDSFERRVMNGNGFQGKMSDVLVVEKEDGIEIVGIWSALGDQGEFQLFIDRQRPHEFRGQYTLKGDAKALHDNKISNLILR